MVIKESEAGEKVCCAALCSSIGKAGKCRGSSCMGWRWVSPPVLEKTMTLSVKAVSEITGEQAPDWVTSEDMDELESFMLRALKCDSVLSALIIPENHKSGWKINGKPGCDTIDDFCLFAHHTRERDPEATGYCGMAGRPYFMGES